MTPKHDPHGDQRISEVLLESGFEDASILRDSLYELRSLALADAPEPRAELAALLTPGVASLERKRWGKRRRTAVLSAAVVGAMGLGAGAVAAANEDFRETVGHTVGILLQPTREMPSDSPASPSPAPSPSDLPGVQGDASKTGVPVPAAPSAPAAPGTADGSSASPSSGTGAKHPLQPIGPVNGHDGVVEQKDLPVLPSSAKPTLPGVPSTAPGRTD